jgi:Flp pilus assembly protein TadD
MRAFPHSTTSRLIAATAVAALLAGCSATGGPNFGRSGSSSSIAEKAADAGDYSTAAALYQAALVSNPQSVDPLIGLGRSYTGLGQYERAEQALQEANTRRPRDPDILLELARTQLAGGKPQAALANIEVASNRAPRNLQVTTAHGIALDRLSRHPEAQAIYRDGLKRSPTDFALLSNLGLSLGLSGQTDEGIRILSELVRDPKAGSKTRGNLALVYGLAGKESEAAATLRPDLPPQQVQNNVAYYREMRALMRLGRPIGNLHSRPWHDGDVGSGGAVAPADPSTVVRMHSA